MSRAVCAIVLLLSLALLLPIAGAHPRATVVDTGAQRCYVYTDDQNVREFWMETNGLVTGGIREGTPIDHVTDAEGPGTGLQRVFAGGWPPDTRLSPELWFVRCVLSL